MYWLIFFVLVLLVAIYIVRVRTNVAPNYEPWQSALDRTTHENTSWRKVLATTDQMQVAAMSVPPGETLGWEVHNDSDQFFHITEGVAKISTNGWQTTLGPGDAAIVPRGHHHNVYNTGRGDLKMYTIYAPPHHAPTVHDRTHGDEIAREK